MTVLSRKQPFNLIFLCNLSLKLNHIIFLCDLVYLIDKKKNLNGIKNHLRMTLQKIKIKKRGAELKKKQKEELHCS